MKPYGILLTNDERTYLISDHETKEELEKHLTQAIKDFGPERVTPIKILTTKFEVQESDG